MIIKRMRWKAIFQDAKKKTNNNNNNKGTDLRSFKIPPPVKELAVFEFELIELVRNIKYRNEQLQN